MRMAIDSSRATKAGFKSNSKETMSISIDSVLKAEFINYCKNNDLKYAPIIEDLVSQYMEDVKKRKKKQ